MYLLVVWQIKETHFKTLFGLPSSSNYNLLSTLGKNVNAIQLDSSSHSKITSEIAFHTVDTWLSLLEVIL